MRYLSLLADYAGDICTIITALAILVKPIRERIFGMQAIKLGVQCLLRNVIKDIYYQNRDTKTLREYEYKTMKTCHAAYNALDGNTFVDHICKEMEDEWEIIP